MKPGDRVGDYVLREKLGEGGFGEVWKAENPDLPGKPVAVKAPTHPDYLAALRKEGRIQHTLDHPNVARTITLNTSADPPYLVMEYVPGESLRARLDREGKLAPAEAVRILTQVLDALSAAHAAGLIHRDIKPGNILLGPDGAVKVTDFGLGKATKATDISVQMSGGRSAGRPSGTWEYMAPEQRAGQEGDERTDLYACGVLLYEMLTGRASPIKLPVRGVPTALSSIVDRVIEDAPDVRYASASEMAAALLGAQDPMTGGDHVVPSQASAAVPGAAPGRAPSVLEELCSEYEQHKLKAITASISGRPDEARVELLKLARILLACAEKTESSGEKVMYLAESKATVARVNGRPLEACSHLAEAATVLAARAEETKSPEEKAVLLCCIAQLAADVNELSSASTPGPGTSVGSQAACESGVSDPRVSGVQPEEGSPQRKVVPEQSQVQSPPRLRSRIELTAQAKRALAFTLCLAAACVLACFWWAEIKEYYGWLVFAHVVAVLSLVKVLGGFDSALPFPSPQNAWQEKKNKDSNDANGVVVGLLGLADWGIVYVFHWTLMYLGTAQTDAYVLSGIVVLVVLVGCLCKCGSRQC